MLYEPAIRGLPSLHWFAPGPAAQWLWSLVVAVLHRQIALLAFGSMQSYTIHEK
jgi:hypothetical protein